MEDSITFTKGQRVRYTDKAGASHVGVVDSQRRGWVMVELEQPIDTKQGWKATKMMLKSSSLTLEGGEEMRKTTTTTGKKKTGGMGGKKGKSSY